MSDLMESFLGHVWVGTNHTEKACVGFWAHNWSWKQLWDVI